jgi:cupin superfamily acireductone dioxygenase involved in methionine salvage
MNKGKEIHGLLKLPVEAVNKAQLLEIKSQRVEIGKLKSYIEEIKYNRRATDLIDVIKRRNEQIKSMRTEIESLKHRCNSLMCDNFNLVPHKNREEELNEIFKNK